MSRLRKVLIVVPLVAAVGAAAWWWYTSRQYAARTRREMALFITEGGHEQAMDYLFEGQGENRPTHYIDIEVFRPSIAYRLPMDGVYAESREPDVNAAMGAFGAFHAWLDSGTGQAANEWDDGWVPHLQRYVADNTSMLNGVKQEAAYGTGMFETDWSEGLATTLPHLSVLRRAARMLAAEAILRARSGDMAGALEDVRLMLRLRRLIDQEPATVSRSVAFAFDRTAGRALRAALEAGAIEQEGAKAILAELEGREERNSMYRAALCETTFGLFWFDDVGQALLHMDMGDGVSELQLQQPEGQARRLSRWLSWSIRADRLRLLESMREVRRLARLPYVERVKAKAFAPAPDATKTPVTHMVVPGMLKALDRQPAADSCVALMRAALGAEMYRLGKGGYPETLEAVVPEFLSAVPTDPYDGKTTKYRAQDGGFVVYSVGQDGKDDGGNATSDVVWMKRGNARAVPAQLPADTPESGNDE